MVPFTWFEVADPMLQDALQDHQCYQNLGIMGAWNFFF
jgi:hypothetical protein